MKTLEDVWQRIKDVNPKSAFEVVVTVMEILERHKVPGPKKAEMLLEIIDQVVSESSSLDEARKKEIVQLKDTGMIMPYIETICMASKHLFKINKKNLFDGKWCNCISLRKD